MCHTLAEYLQMESFPFLTCAPIAKHAAYGIMYQLKLSLSHPLTQTIKLFGNYNILLNVAVTKESKGDLVNRGKLQEYK